jgi:hypothetical protein
MITPEQLIDKIKHRKWYLVGHLIRCSDGLCPIVAYAQEMGHDVTAFDNKKPWRFVVDFEITRGSMIIAAADDSEESNFQAIESLRDLMIKQLKPEVLKPGHVLKIEDQ